MWWGLMCTCTLCTLDNPALYITCHFRYGAEQLLARKLLKRRISSRDMLRENIFHSVYVLYIKIYDYACTLNFVRRMVGVTHRST